MDNFVDFGTNHLFVLDELAGLPLDLESQSLHVVTFLRVLINLEPDGLVVDFFNSSVEGASIVHGDV